jgi:S1-C subfamily serine protease
MFAQKPKQRALSAREIARRSFPSVVVLVTKDSSGKFVSLGSGFFVRPDVVATNYHVVKHAARVYCKIVGQQSVYNVVGLVGASEKDDLALIKVERGGGLLAQLESELEAPVSSLPLAHGSTIAVGDPVYVVGNPEGLEGTFSQGVVSAVRGEAYIQITAPISAGSSGGPVLNNKGEVIGVAAGTITEGQNLNFAIPVANVLNLLAHMSTAVLPLPNIADKAGTARGAEANPTLRETLDWLKLTLSRYGSFKTASVGASAEVHLIFQPIAFQGCTISWKQSRFYEYRADGITLSEVYSEVPLASLDSSSITTQGGSDDLGYLVKIVLFTRDDKKVIHVQIVTKGSAGPKSIVDETNLANTNIYFENRDMTDRITTAFRHAIELCGKQKEAF